MEATPKRGKKGVGGQGHFSDFRGESRSRMLTCSASRSSSHLGARARAGVREERPNSPPAGLAEPLAPSAAVTSRGLWAPGASWEL